MRFLGKNRREITSRKGEKGKNPTHFALISTQIYSRRAEIDHWESC